MFLVHLFVCFARVCFCPFSLPLASWCQGLAAVCDCGIPCTFLLTVLVNRAVLGLMDEVSMVFP